MHITDSKTKIKKPVQPVQAFCKFNQLIAKSAENAAFATGGCAISKQNW